MTIYLNAHVKPRKEKRHVVLRIADIVGPHFILHTAPTLAKAVRVHMKQKTNVRLSWQQLKFASQTALSSFFDSLCEVYSWERVCRQVTFQDTKENDFRYLLKLAIREANEKYRKKADEVS